MAMMWTEDQKKVIQTRNRNLLVSAAAGSGKTAVLVERMIRMVTDLEHPLDIDHILVVTFTNAAAAEMRERIGAAIEALLENEPENEHLERQATLVHHAQITTIHSFCLHMLRSHFDQLDLDPGFRIGDEGELMLLQADVMQELLEDCYENGDSDFERFVEAYALGKEDKKIEEYISQVHRFSMSNPWPEKWLAECLEGNSDASWMQYLKHDVKIQAEELIEQAEEALSLCQQEGGPAAYTPMIEHDVKRLRELLQAVEYKEINECLQQIAFDRLAAVRGKDVDLEQKVLVTSIRDRIKKSIGKMKELYCFEDETQVFEDIKKSAQPIATLLELTKAYERRYKEKKQEKNIVDFNDLEHYALQLLIQETNGVMVPTPVADQIARQYEEIMVDEYQDSNYVQETLISLISRERMGTPNVFMVGDVKQSIYRFRLARPELFMHKYETYSKEESLYQKIELHQNFRSRASVLESINRVCYRIMRKSLGNIEYTKETALHPGAVFEQTNRNSGTKSELLLVDIGESLKGEDEEYTSKEIEGKLIARKIKEMTDPETGLFIWDKKVGYRLAKYSDMVILLRSISGWAEILVATLMNEGIPAYAESKTGYFNTLEVETVLSALAVVDNPMQDIPLAAVMKSPIGKISDAELAYMIALEKKHPNRKDERGLYGAWKSYLQRGEEDVLTQKLTALQKLLAGLSESAVYRSIHELIHELFWKTGYYDYVSAMPSGDIRRANLDMLLEKAISFEATSYHGVFHFIRYIERLKKYNTDFGEAATVGEQEDTVRIMSIHKSKGLEFPIVFAAGMGKQFNKQDVYGKLLIDADLGIGADYLDTELRVKSTTLKKNVLKRRIELESLGEELRVLYVALTRAKEKLILTAVDKNLEKKSDKWRGLSSNGRLPFTALAAAGSFLDWLIMSLPEPVPEFEVTTIPVEELVGEVVERAIVREGLKEDILAFDENQPYDENYVETLLQAFRYQYPYEAEKKLHVKVSVSELKQSGQLLDDAESDFLPAVPYFMKAEEKPEEGGAFRGSAYHRALELLPFPEIHSQKDVEVILQTLFEKKKMPMSYAPLLDASTLFRVISSTLGQRMAAADLKGKLYKERQFVIGLPADELGMGQSKELVLIQGIIDAYFEENDSLILVDYKTDRIRLEEEFRFAKRYQVQLLYYQKALEQMTNKKVRQRIIYSLTLHKEIELAESVMGREIDN